MEIAASRDVRVAVVSTYPPRACGIGTFAHDLVQGLRGLPQPVSTVVAAIHGVGEHDAYDPLVQFQIEELNLASYLEVARHLNRMQTVDVISIQHDFGKFGMWRDGGDLEADYLAPLLATLEKPAVVTMHTVMPHPSDLVRVTVQAMGQGAAAIVVMANTAKDLLRDDYGLAREALAKVHYIPHGVPDCARTDTPASLDAAKRALGFHGHRILSTFGLLNEGKGVEFMIEAMPALVGTYPDLLYLVIGQTHPEVVRQHDERYRDTLLALSQQLGVEQHVRFIDRFLPQDELLRYLAATDVYVTPYLSRDQITSGTLAYALGCGKAIVSTPYLYAVEALADGRGILAEFRNAESLATAVDHVLSMPALRRHLEAQAASYGQQMSWSQIAARYQELFARVLTGTADLRGNQHGVRGVGQSGSSYRA